jgi:hypothetical protein
MKNGVRMPDEEVEEHRRLFLQTMKKVYAVFGHEAFRQIGTDGKASNQVNRAIYDIVMLSFARLQQAELTSRAVEIRGQLQKLCRDAKFQDAIGRATRDKQRIETRLDLWISALQEIGLSCPPIPVGK